MRTLSTLIVAALLLAADVALLAQRDGGQGAGPRQGGGGFRGAGGGGRGGLNLPGRGRGQDVQGTASIRGVVTTADTNTPVRRAQVRATSPDSRSTRLATTDADGRFELRDLPAGRWSVSALKGGLVTQQFGQRHPFEAVEPIVLADAQRFTANFTLSRGSVITGRVTDEFGDPITGARVQVMRSQYQQGRRRLTAVANNAQTDDTGSFRVFGLAPGDYYVSASLQTPPLDTSDNATTYAPTYYPGTGSIADAQRIALAFGTEHSGVNFVLLPVRAVRVSGTVVDSNGAPTQAIVNLTPADVDDEIGPQLVNQARAFQDGTFTVVNVVPGDYVLNVVGRAGGPGTNAGAGAAGMAPEVASMPLTVGNDNLTGISVATTRGASIRGTITADGGGTLQTSGIQVTAQPIRQTPGGLIPRGQATNTGTFELTGLVGPQVLRVDRLPTGWALKSIRANGRDVTDRVVDFRGSEQVVAQVVLTNRITEVSGAVRLKGEVVPSASVVLFPEDATQWVFPSRRVRMTRVDQNGVFRVSALPSGERYLAFAVDYLLQGEFQDPEFLERMRGRASAFTLADGENKNLDLTMIER